MKGSSMSDKVHAGFVYIGQQCGALQWFDKTYMPVIHGRETHLEHKDLRTVMICVSRTLPTQSTTDYAFSSKLAVFTTLRTSKPMACWTSQTIGMCVSIGGLEPALVSCKASYDAPLPGMHVHTRGLTPAGPLLPDFHAGLL